MVRFHLSPPSVTLSKVAKLFEARLKAAKGLIPGGLAETFSPKDFNKEDLEEGIQEELEHTSSKAVAEEIAMDHLVEDPQYYKKLKTIK